MRATVDLAHDLGLEVVGEGVETEAQAARLREIECDYGQGFFLGRPVPFEPSVGAPRVKPLPAVSAAA